MEEFTRACSGLPWTKKMVKSFGKFEEATTEEVREKELLKLALRASRLVIKKVDCSSSDDQLQTQRVFLEKIISAINAAHCELLKPVAVFDKTILPLLTKYSELLESIGERSDESDSMDIQMLFSFLKSLPKHPDVEGTHLDRRKKLIAMMATVSCPTSKAKAKTALLPSLPGENRKRNPESSRPDQVAATTEDLDKVLPLPKVDSLASDTCPSKPVSDGAERTKVNGKRVRFEDKSPQKFYVPVRPIDNTAELSFQKTSTENSDEESEPADVIRPSPSPLPPPPSSQPPSSPSPPSPPASTEADSGNFGLSPTAGAETDGVSDPVSNLTHSLAQVSENEEVSKTLATANTEAKDPEIIEEENSSELADSGLANVTGGEINLTEDEERLMFDDSTSSDNQEHYNTIGSILDRLAADDQGPESNVHQNAASCCGDEPPEASPSLNDPAMKGAGGDVESSPRGEEDRNTIDGVPKSSRKRLRFEDDDKNTPTATSTPIVQAATTAAPSGDDELLVPSQPMAKRVNKLSTKRRFVYNMNSEGEDPVSSSVAEGPRPAKRQAQSVVPESPEKVVASSTNPTNGSSNVGSSPLTSVDPAQPQRPVPKKRPSGLSQVMALQTRLRKKKDQRLSERIERAVRNIKAHRKRCPAGAVKRHSVLSWTVSSLPDPISVSSSATKTQSAKDGTEAIVNDLQRAMKGNLMECNASLSDVEVMEELSSSLHNSADERDSPDCVPINEEGTQDAFNEVYRTSVQKAASVGNLGRVKDAQPLKPATADQRKTSTKSLPSEANETRPKYRSPRQATWRPLPITHKVEPMPPVGEKASQKEKRRTLVPPSVDCRSPTLTSSASCQLSAQSFPVTPLPAEPSHEIKQQNGASLSTSAAWAQVRLQMPSCWTSLIEQHVRDCDSIDKLTYRDGTESVPPQFYCGCSK